jgi:hypothetical protein
MEKPVRVSDVPMHEHECTDCGQLMMHWHVGGCDLPQMIRCDTCRSPKKETLEDYARRGFRADESDDKN